MSILRHDYVLDVKIPKYHFSYTPSTAHPGFSPAQAGVPMRDADLRPRNVPQLTYLCVESPEEKQGGWNAEMTPWTWCHPLVSYYLLPPTSLMTSVGSLYLPKQRNHLLHIILLSS